ncbi:MAG: aminotransferase class V-fold PLP-dependent enzyme [Thermodesulfobacteriota bacterium]
MQNTLEFKNKAMIYLDNAATSWPKPEIVYQTMIEFLKTKGGNPGRGSHSMASSAMEVIEETRNLIARLINAPERDRIIFTFNCTDALNLAIKGLLKEGDHVIISSIEHNSVIRPLSKLIKNGIEVTRLIPSKENGVVSPKSIQDSIKKNTKLVVMTHASNVTGIVQPIEEYGEIIRRHNLVFLVDAAQTAGKYPIDVQLGNIDLLAFSGHKGLLGPPGTGILYIGNRVDLESLREGGTGSQSELEEQPAILPDKFESGTPNSMGISGLGAGIKFIFSEGLDKIKKHGQYLTERLIEGLSKIPGITIYKGEDLGKQVPIISLNINGYNPAEVGIILDQAFNIKVRTGLHCAVSAHKTLGTYPSGTIRISPGYFNTLEDMDNTIQALEQIAKTTTPISMGSYGNKRT